MAHALDEQVELGKTSSHFFLRNDEPSKPPSAA